MIWPFWASGFGIWPKFLAGFCICDLWRDPDLDENIAGFVIWIKRLDLGFGPKWTKIVWIREFMTGGIPGLRYPEISHYIIYNFIGESLHHVFVS